MLVQPDVQNVLGLYDDLSGIWVIDSITVVFRYEDISKIIKEWKYGSRKYLPDELLKIFSASAPKLESSYMIAYVPIGIDRWFARGFNQAKHLAASVSTYTGMPVCHSLFRLLSSTHQARLDKKWRETRKTQIVTAPFTHLKLPIILVDDVISTGATAIACARALKMRGCPSVHVLALARTNDSWAVRK